MSALDKVWIKVRRERNFNPSSLQMDTLFPSLGVPQDLYSEFRKVGAVV